MTFRSEDDGLVPTLGSLGLAFLITFAVGSPGAFARPEFVREGYFTCTSCHVAPGGGGLLKAYGRSFAEEHLVTWTKENEAQFLHGILGDPNPAFAVAGGVRYLQVYQENETMRQADGFVMQADVEGGFKIGKVWFAAKPGLTGGPESKFPPRLGTYFAQWEPSEGLFIKIGKFRTRFGLMLADHTANVRKVVGLSQGTETVSGEVTWQSERLDISVTAFEKSTDNHVGNWTIASRSDRPEAGVALHGSTFPFGRTRAGLQALVADSLAGRRTAGGLHLATGIGERWTLLHETNLTEFWPSRLEPRKPRGVASFSSIETELTRGLWGYLRLEGTTTDVTTSRGRTDSWAVGGIFRPRPHWNVQGQFQSSLQNDSFKTTHSASTIIHYWL